MAHKNWTVSEVIGSVGDFEWLGSEMTGVTGETWVAIVALLGTVVTATASTFVLAQRSGRTASCCLLSLQSVADYYQFL
jgi:hypothetical protein